MLRVLMFSIAACVVATPVAGQLRSQSYDVRCDAGDLGACTSLALMYEVGDGVPQNSSQAVALYARACEGGEMVGCTGLGLLNAVGATGAIDARGSIDLYRRACDGGDALACDLLETDQAGVGASATYFKSGFVVDADTGRPISQAVVSVPRLGLRLVSDASGRAELGRVLAGRYDIVVEAIGYETVPGYVDVPGNALFMVGLVMGPVSDPTASGRIVGRVVDAEGGAMLAGVEVALLAREGARVLTNAQGRFELRASPGLVEISASHIGYGRIATPVVVQPGESVELSLRLSTRAIELAGVDVTVAGGAFARTGFSERRARSDGTFFTAADIAPLGIGSLGEVLQGRTPGVRVVYGGRMLSGVGNHVRAVTVATGFSEPYCTLALVVDDVAMPPDISLDDAIAPDQIEGIEVYTGISTPYPYASINTCGVILVWSKR